MSVVAVDDGQAVLDLVAHFLGIATHDNINAAPSATAMPKKATVLRVLRCPEIDQHSRA